MNFKVLQSQSSASVGFFELPLPVRLNGTNGEVAFVRLNNTTPNQSFSIATDFKIATVDFNYENQILENKSGVIFDASLPLSPPDNEVFVYPVPSPDFIALQGIRDGENFSIYTMEGRLIRQGIYRSTEKIDISAFSPGMYLIQSGGHSFRFIKK